jgi:hypothetical protein
VGGGGICEGLGIRVPVLARRRKHYGSHSPSVTSLLPLAVGDVIPATHRQRRHWCHSLLVTPYVVTWERRAERALGGISEGLVKLQPLCPVWSLQAKHPIILIVVKGTPNLVGAAVVGPRTLACRTGTLAAQTRVTAPPSFATWAPSFATWALTATSLAEPRQQ